MSIQNEERWSIAQLSGYLMCANSDDPMERRYAEYYAPDPKMLAEWVSDLLWSTPQIIRDPDDLNQQDFETLLMDADEAVMSALDWGAEYSVDPYEVFPLVVIATGEQVRAARKALEEVPDA